MSPLEKIDFNGVDVITSDLIAKEHGIDKADINKLYNRNQDRFTAEKDVFIINRELLKSWDDFRDLFTNNKQRAAYLFTERGYFKLVKIMNNDRAWEVYEHMMDVYFRAKDLSNMSAQDLLDAWRVKINADVQKISSRVDELAAHTDYHPDYSTITAWYNTHKLKLSEDETWSGLGKIASQLSSKMGYDTKQVPHPQYGKVNSYHKDVLKHMTQDKMTS